MSIYHKRNIGLRNIGLPALSSRPGQFAAKWGAREADSQELFRRADTALYHVKDNGRMGCCFYKPGMKIKENER